MNGKNNNKRKNSSEPSAYFSGEMILPVTDGLMRLVSLKCDHRLTKAECLFYVISKCMAVSADGISERAFTTSCRELGRIWQMNHETVLSFLKKLEVLGIVHLSSPSAKQLKISLDKELY